MKKLVLVSAAVAALLTMPAMAADLPVKALVAPVAAAYNWTGFYIGANAGYGFGRAPYSLNPNAVELNFVSGFNPTPSSAQPNGFIGGGEIGYNYQFGSMMAGLETDLSYSGLRNTASATGPSYI